MPKTRKDVILAKAIDIIKSHEDGIQWSDLLKKLKDELPGYQRSTIKKYFINFFNSEQKEIYKPERGLFRHTIFKEETPKANEIKILQKQTKMKEEDFYQPFADWLVNELEECTKAIPLGGNKFKVGNSRCNWDSRAA